MTADAAAPSPSPAAPPAQAKARPHYEQLDALRALAVTAVVISHYVPRGRFLGADPLGEAAAFAVHVFFALSGLLITGILLDTRTKVDGGTTTFWGALGRFHARRVLRLFPIYFLVLGLCWAAGVLAMRDHPVSLLTFTYNNFLIGQGYFDGFVGHLWSLSVEQQFYLVWPFLMLLAPRRWLAPIAVATMGVAEAAKYYYLHADPTGMGYYVATVSCADEFAGGALVAMAARAAGLPSVVRAWLHPTTTAITLAGIVTGPWWSAVLPPQFGYANFVLYDVVATTAVAGMLWGAMRGYGGRLGAVLSCRPAARVAAVSYGLYVYHPLLPPLVGAALAAAGGPGANIVLTRAPIALALSVGLSMLSWEIFEKPINELKRYF